MAETKKRHKHEPKAPPEEMPREADRQSGSVDGGPQPDVRFAVESEVETVPAAEFDQLKKELEETRAKSAEYFDGWQRERADFSNYRRRIERDQALVHQNAAGSITKKYLPVLDDLERALKARPTEGEAAAWSEGIELIYRKLQSILEAEGIHRMPAEQEMFDPTRHEAIMQEDSPDHQSGQVIEVVQPGYLIGDRVLRPALVRVAR